MLEDINKVMDDISDTSDEIKQVFEDRKQLIVLNITEKIVRLASLLSSGLIVTIVAFSALTFILIGLAMLIGEALDSYALGFIIMGGCYFLLGLLALRLVRRNLRDTLTNLLIKLLLK